MDGGDFDYTVGLDGSNPPHGDDIPNAGEFHVTDHREFSGLYGQTFWDPAARWHLELGLRLNRTTESRSEVKTKEKKISVGATLLAGGIPIRKTTTKTETRTQESVEGQPIAELC